MIQHHEGSWIRGARRLLCLILSVSLAACADEPTPAPVWAEIGEPLPGLTSDELERFRTGQSVFARPFSPEEGLGPRFNENACNACHTFPADGGTGETSVLKASRTMADGRCDPLAAAGGENLRRQVTPALREAGGSPVRAPPDAQHTGTFTIPFTFGLGLIDAIPLETLQGLEDPDDLDGDGISGRMGTDAAGHPARFGRKADVATLADFVDSAFRLEMGLTTPGTPLEPRAGALPTVPEGTDPTPEPEIGPEAFARVMDFMRFLAPPAPQPDANDPDVERGRALFDSLACGTCHVRQLRAGPDASAAIAHKPIALYSDLLLHDMGPELAATCAPSASPSEFRTEPLMGLRYREMFLHDGRARSLLDAVLLHGGEAQAARDAFAALDRVTQERVIRFLRTL